MEKQKRKRWTKEDIALLKKLNDEETKMDVMMEELERNKISIQTKLSRLGMRYKAGRLWQKEKREKVRVKNIWWKDGKPINREGYEEAEEVLYIT